MKYLLFSTFFLLVLASCKKEESTSIRNYEFGNCLKDEPPIILDECNFLTIDSDTTKCKIINPNTFPLSELAGDWIPYYCLEEEDTISYINELNDLTYFSLQEKRRDKLRIKFTVETCDNDFNKTNVYCTNYESVYIRIQSPLYEKDITLKMSPYYISDELPITEYPENLRIYTSFSNQTEEFYLPTDQKNLTQPFPYEFEYLPRIEILGKTFFEVYTHEEDWKGFYTKIYYNKEYGIVSFVDETGVQWRLDM